MKNPNGYGTIVKLQGNRRKRFAVRVQTVSGRKYIGYYSTRKDALTALADYNKNPSAFDTVTYKELFEQWFSRREQSVASGTASAYKSVLNSTTDLWERPIQSIKAMELQDRLDAEESYSHNARARNTWKQMYDFAINNEWISVNPAAHLEIKSAPKSTRHYKFTNDEIEKLWENVDYETAFILILIYTGARLFEMFSLPLEDIHLKERYFYIRKGKTASATRYVPICEKIAPLFEMVMSRSNVMLYEFDGKPITQSQYVRYTNVFRECLSAHGTLMYTNPQGETLAHVPHDCRHTFASLWAEKKLSEPMRRKIQGHVGDGTGEQVYTHFDLAPLLAEINRL